MGINTRNLAENAILTLACIGLVITIIFIGVIVAYICSDLTTTPPQQYSISGIDKYVEISNNEPIKLTISGINNTIKILQNTSVTEIIISGCDNIIYIPANCNPTIKDSGIDTQIIYY